MIAVDAVLDRFETRLAELTRPQFRDEFLRRCRRYRQPLALILQDLPVRARTPLFYHFWSEFERSVPFAGDRHWMYLVGEFAAFLIGRLDDFDGIDVVVRIEDEGVLWDDVAKYYETCQYDGISVRFAFENLPLQEHILGFHCAIALPVLFPERDTYERVFIDECECWWRDAVCVREFDERRKNFPPNENVCEVAKHLLKTERQFQCLDDMRGTHVDAFDVLVKSLYEKRVFVNLNSWRDDYTELRHKQACGSEMPQTLMRYLHEAVGGAAVVERARIDQQRRRIHEHCRRYTFMNFLKPYCKRCRARQRLALARVKWWHFEACESLSGRWFRSAIERYSAEPRMQQVRQPAAVEASLQDIRLSSDAALLVKRAFLLWNMRAAAAVHRYSEFVTTDIISMECDDEETRAAVLAAHYSKFPHPE